MKKDACVIALTHLNDKKVVFKNRDRNYTPSFKIHHIIADNGTEIVYFQDTISGWVEGINEYGICITNAALAVNHDEKEGKKRLPGDRNRFSKDAWRFLEALKCKSLLEAVDRMTNYRKGVRGHTIVTDHKNTFIVEMTSQHQAKVEEIVDKNFVRTNHGARHPDAGYTHGESLESSKQRQEKTYKLLETNLRSPMDITKKLYRQRIKEIDNPFNVVRKVDMYTSNQIIFEPSKKKMTIITIDEDAIYEGYEKQFKGPAKCKVCVKKIYESKDGKVVLENVDLNPLEVKPKPTHKNSLKVFAYGSLMYEPISSDDICNEGKAFINGISRNLNMQSKSRGHLVFGTLHTSGAPETINRIIDVFPPEQQSQIRAQISTSLKMVVTQRLLKTKDGQGRVGAFEVMKCTPPIQNLIREAKIHQIPSIMQTAVRDGMITMEKSLEELVKSGKIDSGAARSGH